MCQDHYDRSPHLQTHYTSKHGALTALDNTFLAQWLTQDHSIPKEGIATFNGSYNGSPLRAPSFNLQDFWKGRLLQLPERVELGELQCSSCLRFYRLCSFSIQYTKLQILNHALSWSAHHRHSDTDLYHTQVTFAQAVTHAQSPIVSIRIRRVYAYLCRSDV